MAGKIVCVAGSSQSGKSTYVKQQTARASRVIVWDAKHEYDGAIFRTPAGLLAALRATRKGAGRIVYRPSSMADFDWWARCAYAWAVQFGAAAIIAEETADVTSPGKAPAAWGTLLRRVLCTGSDVYAISQRPAESDKTALGNATVIHCGRLARLKDRAVMAAEMDVPRERLDKLRAFEWIERHADGGLKVGRTKKI